jgi:pyridoxine 4-dehydrogenase
MTATSEITGRFPLGDRAVNRMGFGGMKLTGRRLMGPPADREAALAVLRRAVELGVDHIDTSDNFGPLPRVGRRLDRRCRAGSGGLTGPGA